MRQINWFFNRINRAIYSERHTEGVNIKDKEHAHSLWRASFNDEIRWYDEGEFNYLKNIDEEFPKTTKKESRRTI